MARTGAAKMVEYRRRKQSQGLRLVQLWAYDRNTPAFHERLRREAELVRGHPSTREANALLDELLDEALADRDAAER